MVWTVLLQKCIKCLIKYKVYFTKKKKKTFRKSAHNLSSIPGDDMDSHFGFLGSKCRLGISDYFLLGYFFFTFQTIALRVSRANMSLIWLWLAVESRQGQPAAASCSDSVNYLWPLGDYGVCAPAGYFLLFNL